MIAKCANFSCSTPFRYLHEGRLFRFEADAAGDSGRAGRRVEHFWLCERCARTLTLEFCEGRVVMRPAASPSGPRLLRRAAGA
jgi:hypothetical protein